jgi:hypothetical protein
MHIHSLIYISDKTILTYPHNGDIYEADGMREYSTSETQKIVREAKGRLFQESYERAVAGI